MSKNLYSYDMPYTVLVEGVQGSSQPGIGSPADYQALTAFKSAMQIHAQEQQKIGQTDIMDGLTYRAGDGSVAGPAYSWAADTNTGRYRIGDGNVGESIDGVKVFDWNSARLLMASLDLLWATDNAEDIGASGANRPRTAYLGTDLVAGGELFLKVAGANSDKITGTPTAARVHTLPDLSGTFVQYTVAAVVGDLLYWNGGANWDRLAGVATGNALISGGVGAAPSWGKIGLTTHVSGVLPIANGGTNSSTALNNNQLIVSSGGALVEAAAQTNGQLPIGSTGAAPVMATLTQAGGVSITNAAGAITIASRFRGVVAEKNGNTSLTNSTWTTIAFEAADHVDTDAFHDPVTNNTRITIPTGLGGVYAFVAQLEFAVNSTGERFTRWLLNGVFLHQGTWNIAASGSNSTIVTSVMIRNVAAGDYLEVQGFQSSGGDLNVSPESRFSCIFLGTT